MAKLIDIYLEDLQEKRQYELGTKIGEICNDVNPQTKGVVLGALVNNKVKELTYEIYKPKNIRFIDVTHPAGMRMYVRSLTFVLYKAVNELFPGGKFRIEHSISNGLYCRLTDKNIFLAGNDIVRIKNRMKEIVAANLPIKRYEVETQKAIELFEGQGLNEKTSLLLTRGYLYTSVFQLDNQIDYYYGFLAPSTGVLNVFDLIPYYRGMLLLMPRRDNPCEVEQMIPQEKMLKEEHSLKDIGF